MTKGGLPSHVPVAADDNEDDDEEGGPSPDGGSQDGRQAGRGLCGGNTDKASYIGSQSILDIDKTQPG